MLDGTFIVPAPRGDSYVELAARDRKVQGRLFRKQILRKGPLIHPKTGQRIDIDDAFVGNLRRNFDAGVCDIVQVPLANDKNQHVENPGANIGEVVGIEEEKGNVYALIDARDQQAADKLGKTMLGASAFLSLDYPDTNTGRKSGPTLLHVAVTNRPYVTGLEDYQEIVAATAGEFGDADYEPEVLELSEEDSPMTREEMIAALKADHGIDVEALQSGAGTQAQLAAAIKDALAAQGGSMELTAPDGTTVGIPELVGAVAELAQTSASQRSEIDALRLSRAEQEIDGYVATGRVLPKQRDKFVELAMNDRETMEVMLPDAPVVALNQQEGVTPPQGEQRQIKDVDEELAALSSRHAEFFSTAKK